MKEGVGPLTDDFNYLKFLEQTDFSTNEIKANILDESNSLSIFSSLYSGSSWFKRSIKLPKSIQDMREQIEQEVRHHYKRPYESFERFVDDLMDTNRRILTDGSIEVAAPFWVHIEDLDVSSNERSVRTRVRIEKSLYDSERVKAWHSYRLRSGEITYHPVGWKSMNNEGSTNEGGLYEGISELKHSPSDILSLTLSVNLDDIFGLVSKKFEIDVSDYSLWPILVRINEAENGKLDDFFEGKISKGITTKIKVDTLELAANNLLSSLGFRTAMVGFAGIKGMDLLIIPPSEDYIIVVECSRQNPKQKVASLNIALERLREILPHHRFRGLAVISDFVHDIARDAIDRSDIAILDKADIKLLKAHMEVRPSPDLIMNLIRGIHARIPSVRYSHQG